MQLTANDLLLLKRLNVPVPRLDFEAAMQQLMAFRNEWVLHRRQCDFTKQPILSAYPEKTVFPVYRNDIWWGDQWDPFSFGREIDFSRPFFPQLLELQSVVPREGTSVFNSENCDYNGHIRESRNCYLNSLVYKCEDTHYSYWMVNDKDTVDCLLVNNSTLAYDCVDCDNIYEGVHLQDCLSCSDCHFSYQLRNCNHCIGCFNLVNKSFYIENRPVGEAGFTRLKNELLNGGRAGYQKGKDLFSKIFSLAPHRAMHNVNTENCVGDHLTNSKNCIGSFDGQNGEDANGTISYGGAKSTLLCYSAGWPDCEDVYMSTVTRGSQNIAFCYYTFFSNGLRYCDSSMSCNDCFGCVGLRRAKNSILNKSYSKVEYDRLVKRLIAVMTETGEWGQYMSKVNSTFPYNQTAAMQYFPLTQDRVRSEGWSWKDYDKTDASKLSLAPDLLAEAEKLPEGAVFRCKQTSVAFKIIRPELGFYQKLNLPPPVHSPQARHQDRLTRRNGFKLYSTVCAKTGQPITTSFNPDRGLKLLCESAYLESLDS